MMIQTLILETAVQESVNKKKATIAICLLVLALLVVETESTSLFMNNVTMATQRVLMDVHFVPKIMDIIVAGILLLHVQVLVETL